LLFHWSCRDLNRWSKTEVLKEKIICETGKLYGKPTVHLQLSALDHPMGTRCISLPFLPWVGWIHGVFPSYSYPGSDGYMVYFPPILTLGRMDTWCISILFILWVGWIPSVFRIDTWCISLLLILWVGWIPSVFPSC
jgi:hypothetical protein